MLYLRAKISLLLLIFFLLIHQSPFAQVKVAERGLGSRMFVKVQKDLSADLVEITIVGPADRWYAVAFRKTNDSPFNLDCIVVNPEPRDALFPGGEAARLDNTENITVVSNSLIDSETREVVVTRPLDTGDPEDFVFDFDNNVLVVTWAIAEFSSYNLLVKHGNSTISDRDITNLFFTTLSDEDVEGSLNQVSIFPNPTKDILHIEGGSRTQVNKIKVYDLNSKLLKELRYEIPFSKAKIDLSFLAKGLYVLEISNGNSRELRKIIMK